MFENCTIINECEEIILQNLNGISFLGQIELRPEDVKKLGDFIKSKISNNPAFGIEQIEKYTPACLCLYLVWKGILNYDKDKADYWTAVSDELGVTDVNLQTRMGKIFIDLINNRNLKNIEIEDSYQYVTPILLHGGIPTDCLSEFFEKFILQMVKTWKADKEKIKDYLYTLRTHENKRNIIKKEITDIKNQINYYSRIINSIKLKEKQFQKYFELLENKNNITKKIYDVNNRKKEFEDKYLLRGNLTIDECVENLNEYIKQYESLKDIDMKIKQARQTVDVYSNLLDKYCSIILNSKWDSEIAESILNVEPDIITEKIEKYHTTLEQSITQMNTPSLKPIELIGEISILILMLFLSIPYKVLTTTALFMLICLANVIKIRKSNRKKKQIEYEAAKSKRNIIQYLNGIPIKEDILPKIDIDIPGILNQMKDTYTKYQESYMEYESYLQYKNTIEQEAAALLQDTLSHEDTEIKITLVDSFKSMVKKAEDILCRYKQLENDINLELDKLYQADKKNDEYIQQMREKLFRDNDNILDQEEMLKKHDNSLCYDTYIESISSKIREQKARLQLKENMLSSYSQSISLLNEPVYRFIVYGGNWAEMIISESADLIVNIMNSTPSSDICSLPDRIKEKLYKWYDSYKIKRLSDRRPKDKKQEVIVSPDIVYDNAVGGVKIVMNPQQLLIQENTDFDIHLDIEYSNPLIEKQYATIYAIKSDDFIQTEPCELFVNDLFGEISVTLSTRKETYSWKYTLLTDCNPYLAFNEKGKLINSNEISGKLIWLILSKGCKLSDKSLIIEESIAGGNAENTSIYLVDLYGEGKLRLMGNDGSELILSISNSGFFTPYIEGGEISTGITFGGEKVYKRKPEYLVIPSDEESLKYWSITISYGDGSERHHFVITDLMEVEKYESRAKISLSKNGILKENQQGKNTIYLFYRKRRPFIFVVNIINDLYICQKPDFFALPLESNSTVDFELAMPEDAYIEYITPIKTEEKLKNIYKITTEPGTGFVEGILKIKTQDDKNFEAPITLEIPIVRWRINGLSEYEKWSCFCEELWLGKWNDSEKLILEIYIPSDLFRYLRLFVGQYEHIKTLEIKDRIASIDIKGFYDSLKSGDSHKKMFIDFFNKDNRRLRGGYLFSIQCTWEVINFRYTLNDTGDKRKVTFCWNEKGIGENRAARIWKLWEPRFKPMYFNIPDGEFTFSIEEDKRKIPDGDYLLQFVIIDLWGNEIQDDSIPNGKMNTFRYTLCDGTPYVHDWEAVWRGDNWINIIGSISHATGKHRIMVKIFGICKGIMYQFISNGLSNKDGSFNIIVRKNNTDGIKLKDIAHWIGLFLDDDHGYYEYYLMPDPACLEWKFRDIPAESLKNRENNFEINMKTEDKYLGSYTIDPKTGQQMIESIINRQNIRLDVILNQHTKGRLVYQADKDEIFLNIAKGVKCCSCGILLASQSEWFEHSNKTHCKSLNPNYSKAEITLYIMWRSRITYKYLNGNVLLFSNRCNPIPEGFEGHIDNSEQITKLLWEREKEFI